VINYSERLLAIRGLEPISNEARAKLDVTNVGKGGYIELANQTWKVTNVFYYLDVHWSSFKRRKKDYWVCELELFSLNTGEISHIEWEKDDSLEVSQTDCEIKLRDILFNHISIKRGDLDFIADEEEGVVLCNGINYSYIEDDTWAGLFMTSKDDSNGIPMRAYEFESNDGKCLTIETWHQESDDRPDREAFLSHAISHKDIVVIQQESVSE